MSAVAALPPRALAEPVARLLARCAFGGALVYASGDRLRLLISGAAPGDETLLARLRVRKPEVLDYLAAHPPPVVLDFETMSAAKLNRVAGRRYARHPSTEVLCAVALLPDGESLVWTPSDPEPARLFAEAVRCGVVAHAAQAFDRWVWETKLGWPEHGVRWLDSAELARMCGFDPASLEALARLLREASKDEEGSKLADALNRKYARTGERPAVTDEERARIVRYCRNDVLLLARVFRSLLFEADAIEPAVRDANSAIQRRGFALDSDLALAVIETSGRIAAGLAVSGAPIRSLPKLREWLAARGVKVRAGEGALDIDAVEALLECSDLSAEARGALDARLFDAAIGVKKLRSALRDVDEDGRIREALRYCGTHTGRWTGVGLQPQNLPKGLDERTTGRAIVLAFARDADGFLALARERRVRPEALVGALVRPCIVAPNGCVLGIVDYASIEPRVLLWLAGDDDGMLAFRAGEDVYVRLAERLYGAEPGSIAKDDPRRLLGKVATLGLAYGMGAPAFRAFAESEPYSVDWSRIGVSPDDVVERWRDANPRVAGERVEGATFRCGGLWQRLNAAGKAAVRLRDRVPVGRLIWGMQGHDLLCVLPSGRSLRWQDARIQRSPKGPYDVVTFYTREKKDRGFGEHRRAGFSGLWTENVVQAVARDILAAARVRLERAGLPVVLHVHDEVVCELDDTNAEAGLRLMEGLCEELPPWAGGLPLKAEGFLTSRYRKG